MTKTESRFASKVSHVSPPFKRKHNLLRSQIATNLIGTALLSPAILQAAEPTPEIENILVMGEQEGSPSPSLSKFTESLLNTPQSISSISRDQLEDRGAMSLDDALRNVPGITLGAGEFSWQGNNPSIRGFSSRNDMFLDGMRDLGSYTRDPFNLDSVEVLQGPSSMIFGRGSTGGVINQTSKQPVQESVRKLHMNIGNASTMRVTGDFNQPLDIGTNSAFRVNLLSHKSEVPGRDVAQTESWGVAPSLTVGFGSATALTLSYFKLKSDSVPDYGLPWVEGQPAAVDRENYYGFRDDYLETKADVASADLRHRINEVFSLQVQTRFADYQRRSRITEPQVDPATSYSTPPESVTVERLVFGGESQEKMLQLQVNLRADFDMAGITHSLVTGLESSRETSNPIFSFAGAATSLPITLPVPSTNLANPSGTFSGEVAKRLQSDATSTTLAAYLLDTIKLNDQWQLVAGLRWDRFKTDYREVRFEEDGSISAQNQIISNDSEPSYRSALVYKPTPEGTIYLGWGTSFNPSSESVSFISSGRGLGTSNANLEPEQNESLELGTKWNLVNNQVLLDAAIFQITKNNARVPDPDLPGANTLAGTQQVKGLSLNMSGNISDNLRLNAGYAYLDDSQENEITGVQTDMQNVAEHSFSLWADWALNSKTALGSGFRYVDERTAGGGKWVDDYWVIDAMAKYQWSPDLSLRLNLTNLTNEYYYDQIHPWHVIPGHGLGAVFAVNLDL